jgi:hypothetical protein
MALLDAGWPEWDVDSDRVAVIIGNAIGGEKHYESNLRIEYPLFAQALARRPSAFARLPADVQAAIVEQAVQEFLRDWFTITEDTMPGELANIIAGRVAALFNFRGPNFTTDAACASGLAGMTPRCRVCSPTPTTPASPVASTATWASAFVQVLQDRCAVGHRHPALRRRRRRLRHGRGRGAVRAQAPARRRRAGWPARLRVILGLAGSSDGKGKGITAPNPVGQKLAVERAWASANIDPTTIGYVEAHGTSTRVGDATELTTLDEVFGSRPAPPPGRSRWARSSPTSATSRPRPAPPACSRPSAASTTR